MYHLYVSSTSVNELVILYVVPVCFDVGMIYMFFRSAPVSPTHMHGMYSPDSIISGGKTNPQLAADLLSKPTASTTPSYLQTSTATASAPTCLPVTVHNVTRILHMHGVQSAPGSPHSMYYISECSFTVAWLSVLWCSWYFSDRLYNNIYMVLSYRLNEIASTDFVINNVRQSFLSIFLYYIDFSCLYNIMCIVNKQVILPLVDLCCRFI